MAIQAGLVGLPNVGKSTLFNALTQSSIPAANYPFCTVDPHIAITSVPDTRLEALAALFSSAKLFLLLFSLSTLPVWLKEHRKVKGLEISF